MSRKGCVAVSYSGCDKNGHIPGGTIWMLTWLPSGYGPTKKDRLLCTFFDTDDKFKNFSVRKGQRPPLIEAVCEAIEAHIGEHPDWEIGGHLVSKDW